MLLVQEPTAFRHQQGFAHKLASWGMGDTRIIIARPCPPQSTGILWLSQLITQTSNIAHSHLWDAPISPQFSSPPPPQRVTHADNGRARPHGGGGHICHFGYRHTSAPSGWPVQPALHVLCAALGTSVGHSVHGGGDHWLTLANPHLLHLLFCSAGG